MKTKRFAIVLALILAVATFSGCTFGPWTMEIYRNDETPAEEPAQRPEVTEPAEPEEPEETPYTGEPLTPAPAGTWATTSDVTEVASGVEYAAARGLLSAVSVYCKFNRSNVLNGNGYYSFGFGNGGSDGSNEAMSAGSGVIYWLDKDAGSAYIVTNYHVVFDVNSDEEDHISRDITVYLYGSERQDMGIPAVYVGGSMYYDLAVLYVENSEILRDSSATPAVFANSDSVSAGQTAIAIGNPEAGGISVSSGVVSKDSEYIAMTAVDERTQISLRVIRIDTAVNSGNSGGGLYDDTGCLIGVVNAKIQDTQVENIAYAIPSNIVRAITDNILANCVGTETRTVQRGLLGITVGTRESHAFYDESTRKTYIVETVFVESVEDTGAAAGKLQADDQLLAVTVDDVTTEIRRQYDIVDAMLAASAGSVVEIRYLRGGVEGTVTMTLTADNVTSY